MNKLFASLAGFAVVAMSSMTVSAFDLIDPAPGSEIKVTSLKNLTLKFDTDDVGEMPDKELIVKNAEGTQVSTGYCDFDPNFADFSIYYVTFSPAVSTPGNYTLEIPANLSSDNANPAYTFTVVVEENKAPACIPTLIEPASGEITQSYMTPFDRITLTFGNETSLVVDENLISLTDADGNPVKYTLSGWYLVDDPMLEWAEAPFVNIEYNADGQLPSGTYTLTCNPGAFTSPRGVNETKITETYTYTKTKADPDPTPLVIEKALMGGAISKGYNMETYSYDYEWVGEGAKEVTENMAVAEFVGTNNVENGEAATGFLLTLNHGEKAGYVTYELKNVTDNEIITQSECIKQTDNTFLIAWASTTKLFKDNNYTLEIRTYDNVGDMVQFGDGAELTFTGTSLPYVYSDAEFVAAVPTNYSKISSVEGGKITVLFSKPVKATAQYSLGISGGTVPMQMESANYEEDYCTVWTTFISEDVMKAYPEIYITVVAYDEDGNIVKGNDGGIEENSANALSYYLTMCQPRALLKQTNSHVSEINIFDVYSSKGNGINFSWGGYPYVVNAAGEKVASINMDYNEEGEFGPEPFKPVVWSEGDEYSRDPLVLEFQMTPAITEKGKYTLVIPEYTFNFGTRYDGETSVDQQYDFYVSEFFPVNYTVDNSTIALQEVELGNNAVLTITPAEGWTLDKLTLNGEDVTENVVNGVYTSEPASAAMNFVAEFAFDGIVNSPVSADEVVSDLNLRGWSEDGSLFVAGLKEGQVVNVYTTGGSLMASTVIGSEDTMKYTLSAGVYIITVTEGNQTVALKLVNK